MYFSYGEEVDFLLAPEELLFDLTTTDGVTHEPTYSESAEMRKQNGRD